MPDSLAPADALGLVGSTIDQVRFDACVDMGGFGLIYRGFHEGLGETVAIKCLRIASIQKTNGQMREALAGRFRDETKLLYRLSQGNLDIVRCISSGTLVAPKTNEYTPYMVLEWLDGCTLSADLKDRRDRRLGGRSLSEAVELLDSAVGGIAYAHSHDVVHRDVKPGNLFLNRTRAGTRMKVLDFGLAKILSDEAIGISPSVQTGIGVHFCSPSYGAPEQFTSRAGAIGPWTDVYSLCLVVLEVMKGDKVRPAANLAQGLGMALDPKKGSPTARDLGLRVPPEAEALLKRALSQQPSERPHDAGVFWLALKEAMVESPRSDLQATFADEGMQAAMMKAREDAIARVAAAQPSPFAGTMLMQDAPREGSRDQAPLPAAGTRPIPISLETFPLAAPLAAPEPMKGTLPINATSPLASSLALQSPPVALPPPPPPTPAAAPAYNPLPPQSTAPMTGYPSATPPPTRPTRSETQTDPRMRFAPTAEPRSLRNVLLVVGIALIGMFVLTVFYWLYVRGR